MQKEATIDVDSLMHKSKEDIERENRDLPRI